MKVDFSPDLENVTIFLNGTMSISRKDFNIKGNLFGFKVAKNVEIELHVPANFDQ